MKYQIIILGLFFSLLITRVGIAQEYTIKPPIKASSTNSRDIYMHAADINYETWSNMSDASKHYFLVGYFMGLQFGYTTEEDDFWKYFNDLKGMTISQVADTIDKFYKDYPQIRDKYSLIQVIWKPLQNLRTGKNPLTE
jgi:hypothetical protein